MPSERGRLHPLTIVFSSLRIARGLVLPALVGGASAGGGELDRVVVWVFAFLSIPAFLAAFARYFTFRYGLDQDDLIIDSGVLSRRHRVIPLARIQNLEVRQSALQRIAGVAELRVETAGGVEAEAVLSVLRVPEAQALRSELLGRGKPRATVPADAATQRPLDAARSRLGAAATAAAMAHAGAAAATPTPLVRLSTGELMVAGATANEAGLFAAAIAGGLQFVDELPIRLPEAVVDPGALAQRLPLTGALLAVVVVAGLAVVFLLLGWIFSIIGAMVGYHGFTLERAGDELRTRYGLLNRREAAAPLARLQAVRVEQTILRRAFGLCALKLETAGGGPAQGQHGGAELVVPLVRRAAVPGLLAVLLDGFDYDAVRLRPAHPRARRRAFLRYSVPVVGAALGLGLFVHAGWLALLGLEPLAYLAADRYWRELGHARLGEHVLARVGLLERVTWIVPEKKVQTVHVRESPFQRRHGIVTVLVDTASGGRAGVARVIDIARADALALFDQLVARAAIAGRH
ncbi:MAG: PH domain-containing protein [Gemmatimonadetes bacterium]|nr:PH domain-containing protein [Gemmatimonadota bacterium]